MDSSYVVGLFYTASEATDAANRLATDGVPASRISVVRLRNSDPLPPTAVAQSHGYASDPLWGSLVLKHFGERIGDGEAALCVELSSEEQAEADLAINTMKQYVPIAVEILPRLSISQYLSRAAEAGPPSSERR